MKKIINKDSNVVEEMLSGYLSAYSRYYERIPESNGFYYKKHRRDKVVLVIGGGSGHEPLFNGFAGKGLADAVACGDVFAAPNPFLISQTAKGVYDDCASAPKARKHCRRGIAGDVFVIKTA